MHNRNIHKGGWKWTTFSFMFVFFLKQKEEKSEYKTLTLVPSIKFSS